MTLPITVALTASCSNNVSDFVDIFTNDAQIACDIVSKQDEILDEMSRVAARHGYVFDTAFGTVQAGAFIPTMTKDIAHVFVTNDGYHGVTVVATFAALSNPTNEQREELDIVVADLVNGFNEVC